MSDNGAPGAREKVELDDTDRAIIALDEGVALAEVAERILHVDSETARGRIRRRRAALARAAERGAVGQPSVPTALELLGVGEIRASLDGFERALAGLAGRLGELERTIETARQAEAADGAKAKQQLEHLERSQEGTASAITSLAGAVTRVEAALPKVREAAEKGAASLGQIRAGIEAELGRLGFAIDQVRGDLARKTRDPTTRGETGGQLAAVAAQLGAVRDEIGELRTGLVGLEDDLRAAGIARPQAGGRR